MGLFDRLFGYRKVQQNIKRKSPMKVQDQPKNENAIHILECGKYIKTLLAADRYIARSEYSQRISAFSYDVDFFPS